MEEEHPAEAAHNQSADGGDFIDASDIAAEYEVGRYKNKTIHQRLRIHIYWCY